MVVRIVKGVVDEILLYWGVMLSYGSDLNFRLRKLSSIKMIKNLS